MAKRLRKTLSLAERVDVLGKIASKESQAAIAAAFGVNQSQVSRIARDREKILGEWHASGNPGRKRRRAGKADAVEDALLSWFRLSGDGSSPVTGPLLVAKADELARELGRADFKATSGWLERWKARNSISFKQRLQRGRQRVAPRRAARRWHEEVFPELTKGYAPKDVFVADETGVPPGVGAARRRVTLLLCANLDGSEKRPPLVVGTSKNPRCFRDVPELPLAYEASGRARVTAELWDAWLAKLDESMRLQGRSVLVLCGSRAAARGGGALSHVKLARAPSDLGASAGVAENFRGQYRALALARERRGEATTRPGCLNLLDSLLLQKEAWTCVTPATIASCYRKAGIGARPTLAGDAAGERGDNGDGHTDVDRADGATRDVPLSPVADDDDATQGEKRDAGVRFVRPERNGDEGRRGDDATGGQTAASAAPRAYTFSGALESLAYVRGFLESSGCGVCSEYFALRAAICGSQTETAPAAVTKSCTSPEHG